MKRELTCSEENGTELSKSFTAVWLDRKELPPFHSSASLDNKILLPMVMQLQIFLNSGIARAPTCPIMTLALEQNPSTSK